MVKDDGAFLTIGELARDLGVAQHILRYWESRFPQLRPLQRSGNRRYYRPADVDLVRRINRLLNEEGFTVKGAQRALADGAPLEKPAGPSSSVGLDDSPSTGPQGMLAIEEAPTRPAKAKVRKVADVVTPDLTALIARLADIREDLEKALNPG